MAAVNYFKECINLFTRLHKDHPTFSIGRHIATAMADYGDLWSISNKEFLFALEKYEAEMELNSSNTTHEKYVEKVVKDAMDLDHILDEEEDDDDY